MTTENEQPLTPRRDRKVRSSREQTSALVVLVIRVGFFVMMSSLAILLAVNGWKAIRDQHFDNRWTTTTTTGVNLRYDVQTTHGEEILDGAGAIRFGIGMLAAATMLAEWSVGIAISIVRGTKATDKMTWTALHCIATLVSLLCLLTALLSLLPPERIGSRLFTRVFYGTIVVMSAAVIVIVVSNQRRLGTYIFPAVALTAVFISPLSGGIIFGFFAWLALSTHVVLLIPALRRWSQIAG